MLSSSDFRKAIKLINKSSNVLITTHTRPDGDACGSIVAISNVLAALGKNVKSILLSPVPQWYEFLFDKKPPILGQDISTNQLNAGQFGTFDLIIIVDTNSYSQLPKFDDYLKQNDKPVLVIDHHTTADGLGSVELVDTTAAAAGLIVFDLFKYAHWQLTEKIAQALFVAVATDTGWFQFSNTDAHSYRSCAYLIDAGANPARMYHQLYQNFSHSRFKLMTAMLNTLELHLNGRYAVQHLLRHHFEQAGAAYSDTENLVDECRRLSTVQAAGLFVELKDGRIKCSLRSTGPIDVSKIAAKFGGGGHPMAAGVEMPGPIEKVKAIILAEVTSQFNQLDAG